MQGYISRDLENSVLKYMGIFPVTAILGPRQSGKTSIAKYLQKKIGNAIYIDLEIYSEREKVEQEPELFFTNNRDKTIILDEIQKLPEIFALLRG